MRPGPTRTTAALLLALVAAGGPARGGDGEAAPKVDVPAALPEGAVVPDPIVVPPVRPDVYAGRATALARIIQCPRCSGTGTKVTRHRGPAVHMEKPKISETKEDCPDCDGIGFSLNPSRVAPVLDSFVALLGALPKDAPTTPKQLERARQGLVRLGSSGKLAELITAEDRNEIAGERITRKGTAVAVTGVIGTPIAAGAGSRLIPVQVESRSVVFLRAPVIDAAPVEGKVLVGGVVAGVLGNVEWRWGKSVVLDNGFLVPLTEPVHKGPGAKDPGAKGDGAKDGADGAAGQPPGRGK